MLILEGRIREQIVRSSGLDSISSLVKNNEYRVKSEV